MKKIVAVLCIFLLSIFPGYAQYKKLAPGAEKLVKTYQIIQQMYVDSLDDARFSDQAIKSVVNQLDPFSTYVRPQEAQMQNGLLNNDFSGIGVTCIVRNDTLNVISVIPNSHAQKEGILIGDQILEVDGKNVAGMQMDQEAMLATLRGKPRVYVHLKIKRSGTSSLLSFDVLRDKIDVQSVVVSYMLDPETGYLKMDHFGATAADEFKTTCADLKKQGMKNLILDLRSNGGGLMNQAITIAGDLLGDKRPIVSLKSFHSKPRQYKAPAKVLIQLNKLIILINSETASASEILAGALQDWDRGIIVGERSFGKGFVQRQITFNDHSYIRLTVGRYFTPCGRSIQKPYANKYDNTRPDTLTYHTLTTERLLKATGGIAPDIAVSDSMPDYPLFVKAWNSNHIAATAYWEYRNHAKSLLSQFPAADDFVSGYQLPLDYIEHLFSLMGQTYKQADHYPLIEIYLKAYLAKLLYNDDVPYYRILNAQTPIYQQACSLLENNRQYDKLLNYKF